MTGTKRVSRSIAGIILISAALASAQDLKTYKATYESSSASYALECGMLIKDINNRHLNNLTALQARVQKTGDLDLTTAVMAEIKRFKANKAMPASLSNIDSIKALQVGHNKQCMAAKAQMGARLASLTANYDKALDRLQRGLVAAGKIDEARDIQDERGRAKAEVASIAPSATARPTTSRSGTGQYPKDAFKFRAHYYYRLPLRHTFIEAQLICKELGGHILSIDSKPEFEHFKELSKKDNVYLLLDLNDTKREGEFRTWKGMRAAFTQWAPGEPNRKGDAEDAVFMGGGKGADMLDVTTDRHFGAVYCEWEYGASPNTDRIEELGLCEVSIKTSRTSVGTLKLGASRLSGLSAKWSHVTPALLGAQYTKVPWQSRFTHSITVTQSGYLYLYKTNEWKDPDKSKWTVVPDAIRGGYHKSGAIRRFLNEGDKVSLTNYEPGVIAKKITLE